MISTQLSLIKIAKVSLLFFVVTAIALVSSLGQTSALSGSDFKAGRIIDDGVFFQSQSMSTTDIQNFLNAKMPQCDTWGQKQHYTGQTRAQYGASKGYPAPYTCLKDYRQDVPNVTNSGSDLCKGSIVGGTKSAAQIIYEVGRACDVNPQALLVLLQKEQSLVTDDWPWSIQYRSATGYGCPDTAPCDAEFYGYFNQVYQAAKAFKRYAANPANYNYRASRSNFVYYNPNTSACGGSNVYIENQATAGLYIYTPYQPNAAALANLYGSGDGCSAYGNRNFWRMFNDWFGSTTRFNGNISLSKNLTTTPSTARQGETITASYEVQNTGSYDINAGSLGVCGRLNGAWYDFGVTNNVVIPAGSKKTIAFSKRIDGGGKLDLFICSYHSNLGGWASSYYPYNGSTATVRSLSLQAHDNPLISSAVTISPTTPIAGDQVTASVKITNEASVPVNIGQLVIAARDAKGNNVDFPADVELIIPANTTITYSKSRSFESGGQYSYFIANYRNGVWDMGYPKSANGSAKTGSFTVTDNPLITAGVSLSDTTPAAGQNITATMTITNASSSSVPIGQVLIAARDSYGNNVDFPADTNVTIPANSTYTYSKSRSFNNTGKHTFFVANYRNTKWDMGFPKSLNDAVTRSNSFNVHDNPLISSGVTISPAAPVAGDQVTATVQVTNEASVPVNIGQLVIAARDAKGNNVDFPADVELIIPANTTITYSKSRSFESGGQYSYFIANYRNGVWDMGYPKSSGPLARSGSFAIISNPVITSGVTLSSTTIASGQTLTASIVVKNDSTQPVDIGRMVFAVRDPQGRNVDMPSDANTILAASSSLTISKSASFITKGTYKLFLANNKNGIWNGQYPYAANGVVREVSFTVN